MIKVKVYTAYDLKRIIGKREVDISVQKGCTLRGLIDEMVNTWGQELATHLFDGNSDSLHPYIRITVNSRDISFLNGPETLLSDGDEIIIIPLVFGG